MSIFSDTTSVKTYFFWSQWFSEKSNPVLMLTLYYPCTLFLMCFSTYPSYRLSRSTDINGGQKSVNLLWITYRQTDIWCKNPANIITAPQKNYKIRSSFHIIHYKIKKCLFFDIHRHQCVRMRVVCLCTCDFWNINAQRVWCFCSVLLGPIS